MVFLYVFLPVFRTGKFFRNCDITETIFNLNLINGSGVQCYFTNKFILLLQSVALVLDGQKDERAKTKKIKKEGF